MSICTKTEETQLYQITVEMSTSCQKQVTFPETAAWKTSGIPHRSGTGGTGALIPGQRRAGHPSGGESLQRGGIGTLRHPGVRAFDDAQLGAADIRCAEASR